MLMLAGKGDSRADMEALRAQERLFGAVPSDSTVYQTFRHQMDAATLAGVWEMAGIRAQVWRRSSETNTGESVILDIDAKLVEVHSENKEGTAPTYKRGFGSHPMLCFADATGEALAARLRPGNAGANTVTDHLGVLDDAVAQLPPELTAGHRPGDDPDTVARQVVVRTDSAGCTQGFVRGLPGTQHRLRGRGPLDQGHRGGDLPDLHRHRPDPGGVRPPPEPTPGGVDLAPSEQRQRW
jgi:Transposase DDE domain group 1